MMFLLKYWKAISGVLMIAAAFYSGMGYESNKRDAKQFAQQLAAEQDASDRAQEARAQYVKVVVASNKRVAKLLKENRTADAALRTLRERIDHVPETTPEGCPAWTVTPDDRGLWNDALCQGISAAACRVADPAGAADPAAGPGADQEGPAAQPD